jgi:hypothetical protein
MIIAQLPTSPGREAGAFIFLPHPPVESRKSAVRREA